MVAEHTDRARSASRYATRAREDWPEVMRLIASGEVDRLALFEYSRASRDRMVHAALFAACEASGVVINIDGRDYDPNDPSDALHLDIQYLLAVNESRADIQAGPPRQRGPGPGGEVGHVAALRLQDDLRDR